MWEAPNFAEKCEKRLIVRICAGNGLKYENVRESAKSMIPHPGRGTLSLPLKSPDYYIIECQYLIHLDLVVSIKATKFR